MNRPLGALVEKILDFTGSDVTEFADLVSQLDVEGIDLVNAGMGLNPQWEREKAEENLSRLWQMIYSHRN